VQEDFLAVIGADEAEALLLVVELDLAGGHVNLAAFQGALNCASYATSLGGLPLPRLSILVM
jgi:hypothetical protein